jgi:hypothetical protein
MREIGLFVFLGVGLLVAWIANDLGMSSAMGYLIAIVPALLAGWGADRLYRRSRKSRA